MAKKPTRKKNEQVANSTASLVNALKFVGLAQRDIGNINQTHVRLGNHWAVAYNDIIAMGHKIEEDLHACPHTIKLIAALSKCGDSLAITQLDSGRLSVKSGAFKALVPCADGASMAAAYPDPPCAVIDDRLKEGFAAIADLAAEGSQHVVTASVLLGPGTMTTTNRLLLLQYWHGIDLPPNIVLPKASVAALLKVNKPLVKFGFSNNSATFYFEDESWLRTQLYNEQWPDIAAILDVPSNPWPVPGELFKGLDAVAPFSDNGHVFLLEGAIRSHVANGVGASYEIAGVPSNVGYSARLLKMLEPFTTTIDIVGSNGVTYFFGDKIRGALCQVKLDDEIPF